MAPVMIASARDIGWEIFCHDNNLDGRLRSKISSSMRLGFDPAKSARNVAERGLAFDRVAELEWETAIVVEDDRRDYGERRLRAFLYGGGKPYVVVYTMRGPVRWIISFRRAREAEGRRYAQPT